MTLEGNARAVDILVQVKGMSEPAALEQMYGGSSACTKRRSPPGGPLRPAGRAPAKRSGTCSGGIRS